MNTFFFNKRQNCLQYETVIFTWSFKYAPIINMEVDWMDILYSYDAGLKSIPDAVLHFIFRLKIYIYDCFMFKNSHKAYGIH